jgi:hypothetical protein
MTDGYKETYAEIKASLGFVFKVLMYSSLGMSAMAVLGYIVIKALSY